MWHESGKGGVEAKRGGGGGGGGGGGLMVAFLNNDFLIFEFEDAEEANCVLEGGH